MTDHDKTPSAEDDDADVLLRIAGHYADASGRFALVREEILSARARILGQES